MNMFQADCSFDPHIMDRFIEVSAEELNNPNGYDMLGKKNIHVNLSNESSDVSIEELINLRDGMEHIIVALNGADTANKLIMPVQTHVNKELTVNPGDIIVYKLFTDGKALFCEQETYS